MTERKQVDWEAVEREFRAGQLSTREIGREYGVSHVAINKRAKAEGWVRDLAKRVRDEVTNRLVTNEVTKPNMREAVETAAARGVEVVLSHRADISQLRALSQILATRLSQHLDGITGDGPGIGAKESATDMLEKLTRVRARLIPLERQAFNLDAVPPEDDPAFGGKREYSDLELAKAMGAFIARQRRPEAVAVH